MAVDRCREVSESGPKSGPIFDNLYAMAHWTRTQEEAGQQGHPTVLPPPSSRKVIDECAYERLKVE